MTKGELKLRSVNKSVIKFGSMAKVLKHDMYKNGQRSISNIFGNMKMNE
jgi:hypothetical protein